MTMEDVYTLSNLGEDLAYEDFGNYAYRELLTTVDEDSVYNNHCYIFPIDSDDGGYYLELSILKKSKNIDLCRITRRETIEYRDIRRFNVKEFLNTYENITDYLSCELPNNMEWGTFNYWNKGNKILKNGIEVGALERSFGTFVVGNLGEWDLDPLFWEMFSNISDVKEIDMSGTRAFVFEANSLDGKKYHAVALARDEAKWVYCLRLNTSYFSEKDVLTIAETIIFNDNSFPSSYPMYD